MLNGSDNHVTSPAVAPIEEGVDHVRGIEGPVILEYGDYECPYSRAAYRRIQGVQRATGSSFRFAFRHFPLTQIHPHAMAAAAAAEAAALHGRFWEMNDLLFHGQKALEDEDLRGYASGLALDLDRFEHDRGGLDVRARVRRDVDSGLASGVHGTPTLFVDGVLHRGGYDAVSLMAALEA